MAMIKRGVIDDETPNQEAPAQPAQPAQPAKPGTKEAADQQENHPLSRLSDAAAEACRQSKSR